MYISAKLDKSTELKNHIATTSLPCTHFAEVSLEGGRGAEGAIPSLVWSFKIEQKETIYFCPPRIKKPNDGTA